MQHTLPHLLFLGRRQPDKDGGLPPNDILGLDSPTIFEKLGSKGSHMPGQVGRVAVLLGQGHGSVSLRPILFGFGPKPKGLGGLAFPGCARVAQHASPPGSVECASVGLSLLCFCATESLLSSSVSSETWLARLSAS